SIAAPSVATLAASSTPGIASTSSEILSHSSSESSTSNTRNAAGSFSQTSMSFNLLDYLVAHRIAGQVRIGLEVQFFEYSRPVRAHRLDAETELPCDFRHRIAGRKLAEDLKLAFRQLRVKRLITLVEIRDE